MFKFFTLMFNLFAAIPLNAQECMSMHVVRNSSAGYLNISGELSGYHYDFLTALEKESGLCINKRLLPLSRAKRDIQIGAHDAGILARSSDLDADVEYIAKILTSKTVLIPRKGLNLNNNKHLAKVTIARIRKISFGPAFDNAPNISFINVTDYKHGLELIKRGRADAIAGNLLGMSVVIENLNMTEYINFPGKVTINEREVWLVLSKKSLYFNKIKQLRKSALSVIETGELDSILQKYFGKNMKFVN